MTCGFILPRRLTASRTFLAPVCERFIDHVPTLWVVVIGRLIRRRTAKARFKSSIAGWGLSSGEAVSDVKPSRGAVASDGEDNHQAAVTGTGVKNSIKIAKTRIGFCASRVAGVGQELYQQIG